MEYLNMHGNPEVLREPLCLINKTFWNIFCVWKIQMFHQQSISSIQNIIRKRIKFLWILLKREQFLKQIRNRSWCLVKKCRLVWREIGPYFRAFQILRPESCIFAFTAKGYFRTTYIRPSFLEKGGKLCLADWEGSGWTIAPLRPTHLSPLSP